MRRSLSVLAMAGALMLIAPPLAHAATGAATGRSHSKDCSYLEIDAQKAASMALHLCQYQGVHFRGFHDGDLAVSDAPGVFRIIRSGHSMYGIADGTGSAHVKVTHRRHVIATYTITVDPQP